MPAPPPETESFRAAVARLVGAPGRIEALPSGTTGPSYRVETASGRYVVKRFVPGSGALLGPAEQFELLGVLADADIAPRPVAFDRDERLLVTEFLDGAAPLSSGSLRRSETIEAVARCLQGLHAVPFELPRFAPAVYAERYVAAAGGLRSLSARDHERYDELRELARSLDPHPAVLCHNDLLAGNLLAGDGIKLIDFDYAVAAPPVVDLASLAVMNRFSASELTALGRAYFGRRAPSMPPEFAGVQRLVRLLAHFWALASRDAGAAIVAQYRIDDD